MNILSKGRLSKNGLGKNVVDESSLGNDSFDRKLQQWHATALVNVSAATRAQLHQRRRSALAGQGVGTASRLPARRLVWADALALLAIAIALPAALLMPHGPDSSNAGADITNPNLASSNMTDSSFPGPSVSNGSMADADRPNASLIASADETHIGAAGQEEKSPLAALEEDPDLFLWLDSRDAIALASE